MSLALRIRSVLGAELTLDLSIDKVVVNQIFGTVNGLGMSFITLDWSQIAYIGSPLTMPFWAQVHVFGAFVVFYWVLLPILYYTNVRGNFYPLVKIRSLNVED